VARRQKADEEDSFDPDFVRRQRMEAWLKADKEFHDLSPDERPAAKIEMDRLYEEFIQS